MLSFRLLILPGGFSTKILHSFRNCHPCYMSRPPKSLVLHRVNMTHSVACVQQAAFLVSWRFALPTSFMLRPHMIQTYSNITSRRIVSLPESALKPFEYLQWEDKNRPLSWLILRSVPLRNFYSSPHLHMMLSFLFSCIFLHGCSRGSCTLVQCELLTQTTFTVQDLFSATCSPDFSFVITISILCN
jgi:hypothetical protein